MENEIMEQTIGTPAEPEGEAATNDPAQAEGAAVPQEGAAAPADPAAAGTDPAGEGGEAAPQEGEPGEKPPQDPETNRRFAEQRRREEVFRQMMDGLQNPETGKPFANSREFMAWKERGDRARAAQAAGIEPEQYEKLEQQIAQKVKQSDPEVLAKEARLAALEQKEQQRVFEGDLKAIRKAYPDEKAKSIEELGEDFMALMATGRVSAVAAYEAIRAERRRTAPQPPSMGDLAPAAGGKKDFYSREEVAKMSPAEVREHYETIRTSMSKW